MKVNGLGLFNKHIVHTTDVDSTCIVANAVIEEPNIRKKKSRRKLRVAARVVCAILTLGVSELLLDCISCYQAYHVRNTGPIASHHAGETEDELNKIRH